MSNKQFQNETKYLQAQLAEAVGLLRKKQEYLEAPYPYGAYSYGSDGTARTALAEVKDFLARHAQAEQQEAQGAQAGDERAVLCDVVRETAKEFGEKVDEDGLQRDELGEFVHPEPKYLLRICQLYRAALATQSAVPVYLPEANVWDALSMSADTEPEIAWRDGFNDARDRVMNAVRGAEHE